ncbi:sigma-B regulation protein RsbU (phosphoserine phosphatase) [Salirhabdus euzebyi]|uniref:Sigma-B regulation protein RsbU (Phosphoserine phosphatase) n=1 Tax=Salirhabdus euzebyi TaxID=394506 RepID=A0A841Q433_9BACI|nr:SpoIIE family protein phosphatase [Salirhabdus euzebyi]MBB6453123.1 sigma-B regulation protein RsbU (phosphoserine phosphatase) [Salirhabdus euzebyi]
MNEHLDQMPSGFFRLSKDYFILSTNKTLLNILSYNQAELVGKFVHTIFSNSSSAFFQLHFYPLITEKNRVEELYIELKSKSGKIIPVLLYANSLHNGEMLCNVVPITKRNQYIDQLLEAKKIAEKRLTEKNELNAQLKLTLKRLEEKQEELLKVNLENHQYKKETKKELELAKKIQETTLTKAFDNHHLQIDSHYKASSELSGDIYGFYQINEYQYGIILLDVMGHGISSALITMSLETLFQRLITKGVATDLVIQELDNHLHSYFDNNEEAWHYCTAIYLFVDTENQTIEYINAGHPPALYVETSGQLKELQSSTPPLGSFKGIEFRTTKFTYTQGARILLYTDGVSEPLEHGHLSDILKAYTADSLKTLKDKLMESLEREGEEYYKNDDQCFILMDLK